MKKRKNWLLRGTVLVLLAAFLFSAWKIGKYYLNYMHTEKQYSALSARVEQLRQDNNVSTEVSEEVVNKGETAMQIQPEQQTVLPEYAELYAENPDFVGWLKVYGTNVDYPVMQSAEKEYYLYRGFDLEWDNHGSIFACETCDVFFPSDNVTLYGHRKSDGTMFGTLGEYESKEFWQKYGTFKFDTRYARHEYRVFAVFRTTVTVGEGFSYYTFENAQSEEEFNSFVSTCRELSLYDTGVPVSFGDHLVTLSTCEFSQDNGRLVIVAKQVS